jgi:transcriptional pleiotropic repressor
MSSSLLEKTRKLNSIIQNSGRISISFDDLCEILQRVLDANVYVSSKRGKILGFSLFDHSESPLVTDLNTGKLSFPKDYNDALLKIKETIANASESDIVNLFKNEIDKYSDHITIVPIVGNGQRLGTLITARKSPDFSEEDIILAEYAATVVGMEILRAKTDEIEEEERKKSIVTMAIGTLSYSELEAIEHIFDELDGKEGRLVASKIADRVGITRSVIVNALRKFESAGVIESRSLGMKGTYIRVLNEKLFDELGKMK